MALDTRGSNPDAQAQMADDVQEETNKQSALSQLGLSSGGRTDTAQPGIAGAFGMTQKQDLYGVAPTNPFDLSAFQAANAALGQQFQNSRAAQMGAASMGNGAHMNVASIAPVGRGDIDNLTGMLFGAASGTSGPTAADLEFQRANNQNMNNALSLAASAPGHGGNYTAALRSAMRQNAESGQNAALGAGQLRANEQQNAQAQLGQLLPGVRAQDIGIAGQNAAFQQEAGQTNAQFGQQASQQNAQFQQQASQENAQLLETHGNEIRTRMQQLQQAGLTAEQAFNQSLIEQKQFNLQSLVQQQSVAKGLAMQGGQSGMQAIGAGLAAAGTVAAAAL